MDPHKIQRISSLLPFLSTVSLEDWDRAELRTVDPSTVHPIREGHFLQHAIFILKGTVRIYKISEQGREITLYRIENGQSCVLMMASIMGETEYEASVSIETQSELLLIPADVFRAWMDRYKPLRQFIYKQFIDRITAVTNLLENVAFKPIQLRLANFLLEAASETSSTLNITHDQLAVELGTAREVVSRTLKEFQNKGILALSRGKIRILDQMTLNKIKNPSLL